MSDMLERICAATREEVERRKAAESLNELQREARIAPPVRGFAAALRKKIAGGGIGLIAEMKRASPSAGIIREDFDPVTIARAYESGGAACLSVLTDKPFFGGANADLIAARKACALPVLRKDFMLDIWQVAEARTIGADCILLIMAALDDATALDLHQAASDFGMDVLIEVHDRTELERALRLPAEGTMIGVNNRNLKTLKTDLATTETLSAFVPKDRLLVSESGVATAADIARLRQVNAQFFLVGESLLKQTDIAAATFALQR